MDFLSSHTIQSLLKQHRTVITCDTSEPLAAALQKLSAGQIISMPVRGGSSDLHQFIDLLDIVSVLATIPSSGAAEISQLQVSDVVNKSGVDVFFPCVESMSLLHVAEVFTKSIHRVPVLGSSGELVAVFSQSTLVRGLSESDKVLHVLAQKSIDGWFSRELIYVNTEVRSRQVFKMISRELVESIPVVTAGKLAGEVSVESLRGMTLAEIVKTLSESKVAEILTSASTIPVGASIADAVSLVAKTGAHRLWVIDSELHLVGILTLTDIIKSLFS